jgi:hypothetical protein
MISVEAVIGLFIAWISWNVDVWVIAAVNSLRYYDKIDIIDFIINCVGIVFDIAVLILSDAVIIV